MTQTQPTNWQVVGIGLVSGILMTMIIFQIIRLQSVDIPVNITIAGIIFSMVFASQWGIAGALVGRNRKNNIPATWIGAITAIIIGLGSFILLSYSHNLWNDLYYGIIPKLGVCYLFLLPGIPFRIIGATIGNNWKQSSRATQVGGFLGAIIGIILFGWLYLWASFGFASA